MSIIFRRSWSFFGLWTCFLLSGFLLAVGNSFAAADKDTLVERGAYLAKVGDCVSCHTAPGGQPFAGGLDMPTPIGELSTPNITPDAATGIGAWSDDDFYRAMHEGIGQHGEYLYPVFPFPWFTKVSRDDVLAIKAYLFSLDPISAPRRPSKLAFPFDIRETLLAWRTAFFKPATFVPNGGSSERVNRGAYLVEGLGHCGECHNHNSTFGASSLSGRLEGGSIEGWYAPNITANGRNGVGSWSEDELVTFLKTGAAPTVGLALGPMKETIDASLSHLTDEDVHAIAWYLKSVTTTEAAKLSERQNSLPFGSQSYLSYCASCHQLDGRGIAGVIPPLAGNGLVKSQGPENVIQVVLNGLEASRGLAPMPAVGVGMSDNEIVDAVNYVRASWGNGAPANASAGTVGDLRANSRSLLAGNRCPPIVGRKLAEIIGDYDTGRGSAKTSIVEMIDRIDRILPALRASGASNDDIVNAMISASCASVKNDTSVSASERAGMLGDLGGLVYGRLRAPDKQD
jgi:mono/diheme cytochrome c family protein